MKMFSELKCPQVWEDRYFSCSANEAPMSNYDTFHCCWKEVIAESTNISGRGLQAHVQSREG